MHSGCPCICKSGGPIIAMQDNPCCSGRVSPRTLWAPALLGPPDGAPQLACPQRWAPPQHPSPSEGRCRRAAPQPLLPQSLSCGRPQHPSAHALALQSVSAPVSLWPALRSRTNYVNRSHCLWVCFWGTHTKTFPKRTSPPGGPRSPAPALASGEHASPCSSRCL